MRYFLAAFFFLILCCRAQENKPEWLLSATVSRLTFVDLNYESSHEVFRHEYKGTPLAANLRLGFYNHRQSHFGVGARINQRKGEFLYSTRALGGSSVYEGNFDITRGDVQVYYFLAFDKNGRAGCSFGPYFGKALRSAGKSTRTNESLVSGVSQTVSTNERFISQNYLGAFFELNALLPVFKKQHFLTLGLQVFIESRDIIEGPFCNGIALSGGYSFKKIKSSTPDSQFAE